MPHRCIKKEGSNASAIKYKQFFILSSCLCLSTITAIHAAKAWFGHYSCYMKRNCFNLGLIDCPWIYPYAWSEAITDGESLAWTRGLKAIFQRLKRLEDGSSKLYVLWSKGFNRLFLAYVRSTYGWRNGISIMKWKAFFWKSLWHTGVEGHKQSLVVARLCTVGTLRCEFNYENMVFQTKKNNNAPKQQRTNISFLYICLCLILELR